MNDKIVEAFDKFMAEINGQVVTFDTRSEAETAVVMEENQEVMALRAKAYCDDRGYEGKNAVGKARIVTDFMAFEATLAAAAEESEE